MGSIVLHLCGHVDLRYSSSATFFSTFFASFQVEAADALSCSFNSFCSFVFAIAPHFFRYWRSSKYRLSRFTSSRERNASSQQEQMEIMWSGRAS